MNVWLVMNGVEYEGETVWSVRASLAGAKTSADAVSGTWSEWQRINDRTVQRANLTGVPDYQEIVRHTVAY